VVAPEVAEAVVAVLIRPAVVEVVVVAAEAAVVDAAVAVGVVAQHRQAVAEGARQPLSKSSGSVRSLFRMHIRWLSRRNWQTVTLLP
jgi:hypothetical protein